MSDLADQPTILIVDDDEGLLILMEGAMRGEPWRVAAAASGTAARAWLKSNRADLLLLDLKLKDVEAREFIASMDEAGLALPFVVITGQGDERVAVEMMKRGALDYVVKDRHFLELLPAVAHRALAQVATRRRLTETEAALGRSEALKREVMQALLDVTEREQRRFGQDLHDGLGQRLTGLEMLSHALAEGLKGKSADLAKQARKLNRELRETITQTRLMSHSISPVPLEGDGLMRALRELAASTSRISAVQCRFHCPTPVEVGDAMVANHLYRIAQEAVTNALKHGRAKRIDIALVEREDELELSVKNNGRPIPASARPHQGMGLNVMHYRAGTIGGNLSIESTRPSGVQVVCRLRKKP